MLSLTTRGQYKCGKALNQGLTMKLHNTEKDQLVHDESVEIETDHKGVRVLRSKLARKNEWSIEVEADDDGGDPYNSTGKHIVLPDWDD